MNQDISSEQNPISISQPEIEKKIIAATKKRTVKKRIKKLKKVAVIAGDDIQLLGSSSSIFARDEFNIAIITQKKLQADALKQIKLGIKAFSRKCLFIVGNLQEPVFCAEAVAKIYAYFKDINMLVINTVSPRIKADLSNETKELFEHTIRDSIPPMFYLTQAVIPRLRVDDIIINATSVSTTYINAPAFQDKPDVYVDKFEARKGQTKLHMATGTEVISSATFSDDNNSNEISDSQKTASDSHASSEIAQTETKEVTPVENRQQEPSSQEKHEDATNHHEDPAASPTQNNENSNDKPDHKAEDTNHESSGMRNDGVTYTHLAAIVAHSMSDVLANTETDQSNSTPEAKSDQEAYAAPDDKHIDHPEKVDEPKLANV